MPFWVCVWVSAPTRTIKHLDSVLNTSRNETRFGEVVASVCIGQNAMAHAKVRVCLNSDDVEQQTVACSAENQSRHLALRCAFANDDAH
jgi:hypothetical protein